MASHIPLVEIEIPYLYHTTDFFNDKTCKYYNIPLEELDTTYPEYSDYMKCKKYYNTFSTAEEGIKPFTISPLYSIASPWVVDNIFLKYKVNRPLKLYDFRYDMFKKIDRSLPLADEFISYAKENGIDGFIDYSDAHMIYLYDNRKNISKEFQQFDYIPLVKETHQGPGSLIDFISLRQLERQYIYKSLV